MVPEIKFESSTTFFISSFDVFCNVNNSIRKRLQTFKQGNTLLQMPLGNKLLPIFFSLEICEFGNVF